MIVFANAAASRGIDEPLVGRLLGGIAFADSVALAPELPHVKAGELTRSTVQSLVVGLGSDRLSNRARRSLDGRWPRHPGRSASRHCRPCQRRRRDRPLREPPEPAAARDNRALPRATIRSRAAPGTKPQCVHSPPRLREDPAADVLLANRDPNRFDALYAELAPPTRMLVEELSRVTRIGDVRAPVELRVGSRRPLLPWSRVACARTRRGRDVHLTVTYGLEHVRPRVHPGLLRVAGALDRTLHRAAHAEREALMGT